MPDAHRHSADEVTCREFVELVSDYLERALAEERLCLVEEHLVVCEACEAYLEQIAATLAALPGTASEEPPEPGTERVLLAAFREWSEGRGSP
jgi:predicted anti-sigma-YlaC factor YlaD